jgi:hypothetical protein
MGSVVKRYREAAIALYGLTAEQAEEAIYSPKDDPGEWAPGSLAIVNFEMGHLDPCSYYAPNGLDECFRLSGEAGIGFIEYLNAAIGAVYE